MGVHKSRHEQDSKRSLKLHTTLTSLILREHSDTTSGFNVVRGAHGELERYVIENTLMTWSVHVLYL